MTLSIEDVSIIYNLRIASQLSGVICNVRNSSEKELEWKSVPAGEASSGRPLTMANARALWLWLNGYPRFRERAAEMGEELPGRRDEVGIADGIWIPSELLGRSAAGASAGTGAFKTESPCCGFVRGTGTAGCEWLADSAGEKRPRVGSGHRGGTAAAPRLNSPAATMGSVRCGSSGGM